MSVGQEKEQNSQLLGVLTTSRLPGGSTHCLPVPDREGGSAANNPCAQPGLG